jgi:hypothetical protein
VWVKVVPFYKGWRIIEHRWHTDSAITDLIDLGKFTIMTVSQPSYSKEEFAQRGDLIYQTQIRPQVKTSNQGKIVAIDLETGDFEVDAGEIAACNRLEARHPDAQIWIVRVASRHIRRFGGRTKRAL